MVDNLINQKYGYVENVKEDYQYRNIDYRDTTVPLWSELHKIRLEPETDDFKNSQNQINLALCASIIQLGKNMNSQLYYISNTLNKLETKLLDIEKKIITTKK